MGRLTKAAASLAKRGLLYATVKVLLSLLLLADAIPIQVSQTTQQSLTGGAVSITSNLVGADRGFSKAGSGALQAGNVCPGSPLSFTAVPGTASNNITAGDIVYDIQLNTTIGTPPSANFTVTFVITPTVGRPATYTLCLRNEAVNVPNETIDCKFDLGSKIPSSPFSFKITVTMV